jgi:SnoaL-like domain
MKNDVVSKWHEIAETGDPAKLDALLAEDAVFHSPVVHSPQRGKALTAMYLGAAAHVFRDTGFRYVREVVGDRDAVLEFTATIDGIHINGVDMIHWNDAGQIDDFKVMVRPLKAINMLHGMMARMLEQFAAKP